MYSHTELHEFLQSVQESYFGLCSLKEPASSKLLPCVMCQSSGPEKQTQALHSDVSDSA